MSHYKDEPRDFSKPIHPQDPIKNDSVEVPVEEVTVPDKLKDGLEKGADLKENNLIVMYRMGYNNCFKEMHRFIGDIKDIIEICKNHEHQDRATCKICAIGEVCLKAMQRVESRQ